MTPFKIVDLSIYKDNGIKFGQPKAKNASNASLVGHVYDSLTNKKVVDPKPVVI